MICTNNKKRTDGAIVPPLSSKKIEGEAAALRRILGLEDRKKFPVIKVLEILHMIVPGFEFEVRFNHEMGNDHGRTYPDKNKILLREDVYEGAGNGEPRDRFTICHEIGHLLIHRNISFSRVDPQNPPDIFRNSEWQADKFASYLLMPTNLISQYISISAVMEDFGVSYDAVVARTNDMKKS